jgi:hypothetical protein
MYDDTLITELDRALEFHCLLGAQMPLASAKQRAALVGQFTAWLYRQRRSLYVRADAQTGAIERAVDRYYVSSLMSIDHALELLVDCDLTPRFKAQVQNHLWDAVGQNWAALEQSCCGGGGGGELIFAMDD